MNSSMKSNMPLIELLSCLAPDDAMLDLVMVDPFAGQKYELSLRANINALKDGLSMFEGMIPLVHPELAQSGKVAFRVVRHPLRHARAITRTNGVIWIKGDSVVTQLIPLMPPCDRTVQLEQLFRAFGADVDDPVQLPSINWGGSCMQSHPSEGDPDGPSRPSVLSVYG